MGHKNKLIYDKMSERFEWEGAQCQLALEAEVSSGSYDVPWLEFGDHDPDELCKRYNYHTELVEALRECVEVLETSEYNISQAKRRVRVTNESADLLNELGYDQ